MESVHFLRSLPFFHDLPKEDVQSLLVRSRIGTYPKKSTIFMKDDEATRFFVIIHGWVKLYQTTMEGNEAVLALFTRGDSFGEAVVVDGAVYPHSASALEDTKLIEFPVEILKEMSARHPSFSMLLMQSMGRHIRRLQLENEHLAVMTTTQRVACFLFRLCLDTVPCANHIVFPYDKNLAAAYLGMKPETFSRALKNLQKKGVTVKNDDVYIENRDRLIEFCCSNCSACPENCPLLYGSLHDYAKERRA